MNSQIKKPLSLDKQIEKLKEKNITFNSFSEDEARNVLMHSTYFYKIYSYRKNFEYNKKEDKYVNLDFRYLYDLSKLDMKIRYYIVAMALDIEHGLKRRLIYEVANNKKEGNGNALICDYLIRKCKKINKRKDISEDDINNELKNNINSNPFNENLIQHKLDNANINYRKWSIWEFVEVIDFGNLINLCELYTQKYRYNFCDKGILNVIRQVRNSSAHNNCLIDDINRKIKFMPNVKLKKFCVDTLGIPEKEYKSNIKNLFTYSILCLIYCYELFRTNSAKKHKYSELNELLTNPSNNPLVERDNYKSARNLLKHFDFINQISLKLFFKYCINE